MKAGVLDQRVTVQEFVQGQDESGQPIEEWQTVGTWWANIRHLSGLETMRSVLSVSEVEASIRFRKRPDRRFHSAMRVIHDDTVYEVKAVLPGAHRYNKHVDLLCTTTGESPND